MWYLIYIQKENVRRGVMEKNQPYNDTFEVEDESVEGAPSLSRVSVEVVALFVTTDPSQGGSMCVALKIRIRLACEVTYY